MFDGHGSTHVKKVRPILEGVAIIVPPYVGVRFLNIFFTHIVGSTILKPLTQGFQQVQNSEIFVARVRAGPKF